MLNCRQVGQPSAEERRNYVSFCLAQLPCELNPDVFTNKDGTGTLDNYVKNKRQASKKRDGYLLMAAAASAKRPRLEGNDTGVVGAPDGVGAEESGAGTVAAGASNGAGAAGTAASVVVPTPSPPPKDTGIADALHEKDIFEMASMDSSRFPDKIIEKHANTL